MPQVKVYSTPTCMYCITLKKFLQERNVVFEDIDVSKNKSVLEQMIALSGQMGVPVVDIDGQIIVGFDKDKISRLLGI